MSVKLLTEHHLEFLSLKGGCTGSSYSTLAKMPLCWKYHVVAHIAQCIRIQRVKQGYHSQSRDKCHKTYGSLSMTMLGTQYFKIFLELRPDVKATVTRNKTDTP